MGTILTSIHGKLFGIDTKYRAYSPVGFSSTDYNVGPINSEVSLYGTQALTSASTGTTINFGGSATVNTVSSQTFLIAAPLQAGIPLSIMLTSTTTGITRTFQLVSGTFQSSAGSTNNAAAMTVAGCMNLMSASTALVFIQGSSPVTTITLSTI